MVRLLLFSGRGLLRCLGRFGRGLVGCGSVIWLASVGVEKKNGGKANLLVADQPNSWGLVILVVCDHYVVRADLKQVALCDFHIGTTKKSSATLPISSNPVNIPSINRPSSRYNRHFRRSNRSLIIPFLQIILLHFRDIIKVRRLRRPSPLTSSSRTTQRHAPQPLRDPLLVLMRPITI